MAKYNVKVRTLSPVHLSSGQADVTIDAEVIHDEYGMPYFPAKRFKGLLYESAIELVEMSELCKVAFINRDTVNEMFHPARQSHLQLIIHDFHLPEYEAMKGDWRYIEQTYGDIFRPSDILEEYSSIRHQTAIDPETGIAARTSLHNMRVVDAGIEFNGIIEIYNGEHRHENMLVLALRNLHTAGSKRNRGFGQIECVISDSETMNKMVRQALGEEIG